MPIVVDLRIIPVGTCTTSLSTYIAEAIKTLKELGIRYNIHASGTNIEIETFEQLSQVLRRLTEVLSSMDIKRILIDISIDIRLDKENTIENKLESIKRRLAN